MDTHDAILYVVFDTLTKDTEFKKLIENVYHEEVPKSAEYPYLVYRLEEGIQEIGSGRLHFDYYGQGTEKSEAFLVRSHLRRMFTLNLFSKNGLKAARFFWHTGGFIPTEVEGVIHYTALFDVRYCTTKEELKDILEVTEDEG